MTHTAQRPQRSRISCDFVFPERFRYLCRIGHNVNLEKDIIYVALGIKGEPEKDDVGDCKTGGNAPNEDDDALTESERMKLVVETDSKERVVVKEILEVVGTPTVTWQMVTALRQFLDK